MLADLDRLRAQASRKPERKPEKAKKAAQDSPATLTSAEKAEKAARDSLATLRQHLQVDWGAVQHKVKLMGEVAEQEAAGCTFSIAFGKICSNLAAVEDRA